MDTQTDTLAHFKSRPLLQYRDFSKHPASAVTKHIVAHFDGSFPEDWHRAPEGDALKFYLLNHAVSALQQRKSDDMVLTENEIALLNAYHRYLADVTFRVFDYLYLIACREARHLKHTPHVWENCFGSTLFTLIENIVGSDPKEVYNKAKMPVKVEFGGITRMLTAQYFWGSYESSYGGPKWGEVAYTLNEFVHGRMNAELFVDTAWTLVHNTGPVFNKGMVFLCQDNGWLQKILNVQNAGQVPGFVQGLNAMKIKTIMKSRQTDIDEMEWMVEMCGRATPEIFAEYEHSLTLASQIKPKALYSNLDLSFGFYVPNDDAHIASSAKARMQEYYGKVPKADPANKISIPGAQQVDDLPEEDYDDTEAIPNDMFQMTTLDLLQKQERAEEAA